MMRNEVAAEVQRRRRGGAERARRARLRLAWRRPRGKFTPKPKTFSYSISRPGPEEPLEPLTIQP